MFCGWLLAALAARLRCLRSRRAPPRSKPISAPAAPTRRRPQAYWQSITDKRRARFAKRRNGERDRARRLCADAAAGLQRAAAAARLYPAAAASPARRRSRIPTIADFLKAAAEQYDFVPDRPDRAEFKHAYAKVARGCRA